MPAGDRGGLKSAFAGFKKAVDEEAELKLLGRTVGGVEPASALAAATPLPPAPAAAAPPPVAIEAAEAMGQGTAQSPASTAATLAPPPAASYQVATSAFVRPPTAMPPAPSLPASGLIPRPLRAQREAVRQLSFRCPVSLAGELRRKAAFNQLEQQEIIIEGIRRVLAELEEPPAGWNDGL